MDKHQTIEELLSKTSLPLPQGYENLYAAISKVFEENANGLDAEETQILINILWQLTTEIELSMRIKLADNLANRDDAPSELMYLIASDDIRVAYNVLVRGKALADSDLVKIVRHRSRRHQLAITARKNISEIVSNAIVETNDKDVIVSLLNNPSARISNKTMSYIVDESQHVDEYQRPLIRRDDLPSELVERMCAWISDELLILVSEKHQIDVQGFREDLSSASAELLNAGGKAESSEQDLIDEIAKNGGLNEVFLTDTLKQGHVTLFEYGIAEIADADREKILNFLYDYGEEGILVLCRAGSFSDRNYLAVRRLISQAQGKIAPESLADREILLAQLAKLQQEKVRNILSSIGPNHSRNAFLKLFNDIANS